MVSSSEQKMSQSPEKFFFFLFLREGLILLSRLECSCATSAQCNLYLLGSSNSHASASQVAGTIGAYHHTWLIFVFFCRDRVSLFCPAGLELLNLSYLPALASQSAGITEVSHHIQLLQCPVKEGICQPRTPLSRSLKRAMWEKMINPNINSLAATSIDELLLHPQAIGFPPWG